jgi:hypothetical protein
LRELNLDAITTLGNMLVLVRTIMEELDIFGSKIGNDGLRVLCNGFGTQSCKLRKLNLERNHIGCSGASAFATTLQRNKSIQNIINLSNNNIDNDGAAALANVLENNTTIVCLIYLGTTLAAMVL